MNQSLILIAEDDPDVRDVLCWAVEAAGYRTVGAKDGNTAARILTVAQPVGLITDVRMPAMNGIELCRLARSNPQIRDTAIVLISGNCQTGDVDAALESGADRFLSKPISPKLLVDELLATITVRSAGMLPL